MIRTLSMMVAALAAAVVLPGGASAADQDGLGEAGPAEDGEVAEARPLVCKVYLTQYKGHTKREAALPYESLKDAGRRVKIRRVNGGQATTVGVKETGPWNANDAYWHPESRRAWEGLPRCVPEAQAAYRRGYNGGRDQFGRDVLNPAGIDVTPPVARELGLERWGQGAWVYVTFPWVAR